MARFTSFTLRLHAIAPAAKKATPADLVYMTAHAVSEITVTFVCGFAHMVRPDEIKEGATYSIQKCQQEPPWFGRVVRY